MIRIAVIVGKMNSGGKKNLIMEYYRHIDRTRVQFDFICDSDSEAIPEEEIEALDGRVYRVAPYQCIWKNMIDIYMLCRRNRYPVVHSYNSTMNVFPMMVTKAAGVPVRISESLSMAHDADWKTVLKKLLRPTSRLFATHYMSCGKECGRWQFGNKYFDSGKVDVFKTVIDTEYNAFHAEVREKTRSKFKWNDRIVIGHIGRFTTQKNSLRIIDIFSAISQMEPKAVLCLIGDGELKADIIQRIKTLNLEKKVDYLGRREDIQQFYNAMDAFLLPSLYEGLPVVGLEAACCGLPVFFSTEVTKEADACGLGNFIDLSESDVVWADEILKTTKKNIPVRRSYKEEVSKAGFDSALEALRLQKYYLDAVEECK